MTAQAASRCPWCGARHDPSIAVCPLTSLRLSPIKASETQLDLAGVGAPDGQSAAARSAFDTLASSGPEPMRLGARYVVRRLIGTGSCADVYECVQVDNERIVAVKVLSREMAESKRWLTRFARETRLTAQITHSNICRIYDCGTLDDGRPYYAMELLTGEPLSALLERRGALPPREAVDLAIQVVAGLRIAHLADVVHRDIKPANIFLNRRPDGRDAVKILDFGLCKIVTEDDGVRNDTTQLTLVGTFVGSPFYVAPEQFNGSEVDARVDLWAVGVVLYEMLSGVRPFVAANLPSLLLKIAEQPPASLQGLRPGLHSEIVRIVNKSLNKELASRYRDARELLADLVAVRAKLPR